MGEGHVHVCMCPCGHMCDVCQIAHVEVRGLPRLLAFTVHLALTQSPAVPCCVDQVSWPMSFWEFSSPHVPSCHRSNGIIDTRYCVPFFGWFVFNVGPSDPNSGLYVRRKCFILWASCQHPKSFLLHCAHLCKAPAEPSTSHGDLCEDRSVSLRNHRESPPQSLNSASTWEGVGKRRKISTLLAWTFTEKQNGTKPPDCWASNASNRKRLIKPRLELNDEF